jgi:GT2 family glycosyltransferase
MMKISIIIPNRNGARLLQKNLPYVLAAAKGAEVIVVDDASGDNSLVILKKEFPSVRVLPKTRHDGFASTVNVGVKEAKGEIIVLLNTDVRPEQNFLAPLIRHFDDSAVFGVGCLERSYESGKVVLRGRGEAHWERGFFIHRRGEVDRTDTAWVTGGSGAFRKSIWNTLGGMDPMFNPFYWEDIDLSYRAVKAGYKILFEPRSTVVHEHEKGIIKHEYTPFQIKTIAYRNQFLFIWNNLSDPRIWIEHIVWTPVRLIQATSRGDVPMLVGFGKAIVRWLFCNS